MIIGIVTLFFAACNGKTDATGPSRERNENIDVAEGLGKPPVGVTVDTAAFDAAMKMDTTRDGRTVAQRVNDAMTAAEVRKALADQRDMRTFDFDAVVVKGNLRLSGEAPSLQVRERAEHIARDVDGVAGVLNRITVNNKPEIAGLPASEPPPFKAPPKPTKPEQKPAPERAPAYHTVRSGESYWSISRRYGTTVARLQQLNGKNATLQPGRRIRVK